MKRRDILRAAMVLAFILAGGGNLFAERVLTQAAAETNGIVPEFVPGSWTIVILGDTQGYSENYPGVFHLMSLWIAENKAKYNVTYVLGTGDITDNDTSVEWQRASAALGRLEGVVPYALVTGNHDYGAEAKDRQTKMNDYFGPERFANWKTFGGVMEAGRMENSYHLFEAGGDKWIIFCLEWGPRDPVLVWCGQMLEKFSDRRAFIVTHAYLYTDATLYNWQEKQKKQEWNPHGYGTIGGVNDGQEMWDKLIRKHANIFMVINGHVLKEGVAFLTSVGEKGNIVNQMLVNFQWPIHPVGGEGWLRLLEFRPDGKTIQAKTYSPLLEKYKTDADNQFVIER
jgi:hypothetical protein